MTYQPDPGTTLAAAEALFGDQQVFTRDQVAYLLALALDQRRITDLAETLATWAAAEHAPPSRTPRVAARIAEMTANTRQIHRARGWPDDYEYTGGPVDWDTGLATQPAQDQPFPQPVSLFPADDDRVRPRFPSLDEQATWLSPGDLVFCRNYARTEHGSRS